MKKTLFSIAIVAALALFALSVTGCPDNGDPGPNNEDTNQAPTANAGTDFEHNITTSGTTITLNGSGTDTDGSIIGYAWTCTDKPNGSAAPTFSNSAVANPTVSGFDTLGDYEFSLKVKDNENKESTADVVKVSLCMTAIKNVTVSFDNGVIPADGKTLDFAPTYTPAIAGNGFVDGDVEYILTDDVENAWNKTTGYVVNANGDERIDSYEKPSAVVFTQTFKINNETIATQQIKVTTVAALGGRFSAMLIDESSISAIPSIDITLSKKVSAGAIPVLPEYETVTATVILPSFDLAAHDLTSLDLTPTMGTGWENLDFSELTFTLSETDEEGGTPTTYYIYNEGTVSIPESGFTGTGNPPPRITQNFSYNGKPVGSFHFNLRSQYRSSEYVFAKIHKWTEATTAYDSFPASWSPLELTVIVEKQ